MLRRLGRDRDAVASLLDGLGKSGWLALHGVDTTGGRIEHLAVGPGGVFAISTSDRAGRVPVESIDERSYAEHSARARLIEHAIGRRVTPVLVFPYAKLSRPVSRQRGVVVVMAKTLGDHLVRRRTRLTDAEVHSLHHQLVGIGAARPPASG